MRLPLRVWRGIFESVNPSGGAEDDPIAAEPAAHSDAELSAYVRRSLAMTALGVFGLVAAIGYLSLRHEREMRLVTDWVYARLGFPGLMGILFLSDSVITPIPPDALLVVIAKSELHRHWPGVILFVGCFSALAGCAGYFFATHAGRTRAATWLLSRASSRTRAVVVRYGKWAVALGAVTPIPFSITCWFAGVFRIPFRSFAPMTLLRLPRFFVYYLAIAHGADLLRLLQL
jgi:membrane protein YqaA with SNARE-associated domain